LATYGPDHPYGAITPSTDLTPNPTTTGFTGAIDELALYPTALAARRVAAHYNAGFAGAGSTGAALLTAHLGSAGAGLDVTALTVAGRLLRARADATGDAAFAGLGIGTTVTLSVRGVDTWAYQPVTPQAVTLDQAEVDVDLPVTPWPTVTLTGTVTDATDATPVEGSQVAAVQVIDGTSQTSYGTTDDQGRYSITGLRSGAGVTTTVSVVGSRGRAGSTVDLTATHTLDLSIEPQKTYRLQLHFLTQLPGEAAQEQAFGWSPIAHYSLALTTPAGSAYPSSSQEVQGYPGDQVRLCADGYEAGLPAGCAETLLPASTDAPVALTLTLHGAQQVSLTPQRADGDTTDPIDVTGVRTDGDGTLHALMQADSSGAPQTLAVPAAGTWDFSFTSGSFRATRTAVVVASDEVVPLGTVTLSDAGAFADSANRVAVTQAHVAPGGLLDIAVRWSSSTALDDAVLVLDVPAGTALLDNGLVVNKKVVSATVADDHTVTAPIGSVAADAEGTATLHLQLGSGSDAPPSGALPIRARMSYRGGEGLIGTGTTEVATVSLDGPTTTSVASIAVSGHAAPGAVVNVNDGILPIGAFTASASGYWHGTVTLPDRGQGYVHPLYATTPISAGSPAGPVYRSDELDVTYDTFVPTIGDVTLQQDSLGSKVTAPAGASYPFVYVPGDIAVTAQVTDPDRVTDATVTADGTTVPATVGSDGTVTATVPIHELKGPITLEYDEGPSTASWLDQAGPLPDSMEQVRLRLPAAASALSDPVLAAGSSATHVSGTSTVVDDPAQTVTTTMDVLDTPDDTVGRQLAPDLWVGSSGEVVTEDAGSRTFSVTVSFFVPASDLDSTARAGATQARVGGRDLTEIRLKQIREGTDTAVDGAIDLLDPSEAKKLKELSRLVESVQSCTWDSSSAANLLPAAQKIVGTAQNLSVGRGATTLMAKLAKSVGMEKAARAIIFGFGELNQVGIDDMIGGLREIACTPPPCEPSDAADCQQPSPARNTQATLANPVGIVDPSGVLTDGPYSSPLKDATVTILRSDTGAPGTWEIWDAEDFEQTNPVTSTATGAYGWNVPPGWYQVAASAPGHLSAQSQALEVLPPQLGVDLMLPDEALGSVHDVAGAGGTSPSVTVHFGTWMQAATLDGGHLTLTDASGTAVPAVVTPVDPQTAPGGLSLTKTVTLVPTRPAGAGADWSPTLTLHVDRSALDAAGRELAAAISQPVTLAVPDTGTSDPEPSPTPGPTPTTPLPHRTIAAKALKKTVAVKAKATIFGTVTPGGRGTVVLQRQVNGTWTTLSTRATLKKQRLPGRRGKAWGYVMTVRFKAKGSYRLRVAEAAGSPYAGASQPFTLRVRK
ncbi:MAG: carboxypeptidase-like regulatory domain-containing protein, partial [Nocardioides sp.]|uniref:hypothetical protein n=1 Tax=Nocardioides sp. TaxID=35761 RepID=UPI0039E52B41